MNVNIIPMYLKLYYKNSKKITINLMLNRYFYDKYL